MSDFHCNYCDLLPDYCKCQVNSVGKTSQKNIDRIDPPQIFVERVMSEEMKTAIMDEACMYGGNTTGVVTLSRLKEILGFVRTNK